MLIDNLLTKIDNELNSLLHFGLKIIKQEQTKMPNLTVLELNLVNECLRGAGGTVKESSRSVTGYDDLSDNSKNLFKKTVQMELNLESNDSLLIDDDEFKNFFAKTVRSSVCLIGNAKKINGSKEHWQDVG
tara:strand:- start:8203 stop:8595 length:393 start_codon:yes stop_codon:yes gene_type:complete